jgi:hypothetical protein
MTRTVRVGRSHSVAKKHMSIPDHRVRDTTAYRHLKLPHGYLSSHRTMLVIYEYAGLMESHEILRTCTLVYD